MPGLNEIAALILGISLVAAMATQTANATTLKQIKSRGTVKIGMLVDFPPYGIMNENNKPDGYDADVAKLLAKNLDVKLKIVKAAFKRPAAALVAVA